MKDYIKFSIITVCKNSEKTIEKTIKSVIEQTYKNIEYIIIDGKSTDNTIALINRYKDKIANFISEEDNGIYEAMNKGISLATGDFILFLNADDRLFDEFSIERVCRQIKIDNSKTFDVFYGAALILDQETGRANIWKAAPVSRFSLFRSALPHPATFYRKRAFKKNGLFNENFSIAADYEWVVRARIKNGLQFKNIDCLAAMFSKGGVSTDPQSHQRILKEKKKIRQLYYGPMGQIYWTVRWRLRKTFGI